MDAPTLDGTRVGVLMWLVFIVSDSLPLARAVCREDRFGCSACILEASSQNK